MSILVAYLVKTDRRHLLPRDLGGRRPRGGREPRVRRCADLRPTRADLRGAGADRRRPVDRRGRLRDLDDLLDGQGRARPERRAARPDRRGGRGQPLVARASSPCSRSAARGSRPRCSSGPRPRPAPASVGAATPTWEPLLGAALGILTAVALGYLHLPRRHLDQPVAASSPGPARSSSSWRPASSPTACTTSRRPASCPGLDDLAFDVSDSVDLNTWYGALLKGIFNFSPATTKLEAAAWLLYAVPVMALFLRRRPPTLHHPGRAVARGCLRKKHTHHAQDPRGDRPASPCLSSRPAPTTRTATRRKRQRRGRRRSRRDGRLLGRRLHPVGDRGAGGHADLRRHQPGDQVTEFYLLGEDGLRIVAEVENVGPSITRALTVTRRPGPTSPPASRA